jgi:hypothetical protein
MGFETWSLAMWFCNYFFLNTKVRRVVYLYIDRKEKQLLTRHHLTPRGAVRPTTMQHTSYPMFPNQQTPVMTIVLKPFFCSFGTFLITLCATN